MAVGFDLFEIGVGFEISFLRLFLGFKNAWNALLGFKSIVFLYILQKSAIMF